MNQHLKSKLVVITGASAGVGRATAIAFAKHGCQIALIARGKDGLLGAKNDVEKNGGTAKIYEVDVSDSTAIVYTANIIEAEMGPIDIWVNNAMCSVFGPLKEITPEEFKRVTEVTYLGQVYGTMAALKHMLPRNHGTIILVGSALAYRGIPLQSAYCGGPHGSFGNEAHHFSILLWVVMHRGLCWSTLSLMILIIASVLIMR
jgi:NADP-dependent 3-hydroxy acid dehydrogenase YdfG